MFTGTVSGLAGLTLLYGCTDGGSVGIANREQPFNEALPLWRAAYLPPHGTAFEQVGVLVAWH